MIFHEYCDVCKRYNAVISPALAYCGTAGKVYDNHNGVTPTGEYREFNNPKDYVFKELRVNPAMTRRYGASNSGV